MNTEVVVMTGASAGIGRAAAREFGSRGAAVGLLRRGEEGLEAARKEVEQRGGRGLVCVTDVADAAQVKRAAARVEDRLGPIDIWVNNAMVSVFAPVIETTPAEYRRVTETSVQIPAVNTTQFGWSRRRLQRPGPRHGSQPETLSATRHAEARMRVSGGTFCRPVLPGERGHPGWGLGQRRSP